MAHPVLRRLLETPYWTFYAALSVVFLVMGAWGGAAVAGWIPFEAIPWPERSETPGQASVAPANGQRNLLVIGVDRLDRDTPRLESLWLVLYFPGRSPVTLMPLYPRADGSEPVRAATLAESFSLTRFGDPSPEFLERLRHEQVWWSGYVLLDETALAALVDLLGGVDLDGKHRDGFLALSSIPRPWDDRAGALQGQVGLLRSACRQAGALFSSGPEIAELVDKLGRHLRTSVDIAAEVQDWLQAAGSNPALECEFPLMDAP